MNRHRWILTVMAMVVGVALAGSAMGTGLTPEGTKKLQQSAPAIKTWNLSMKQVEFKMSNGENKVFPKVDGSDGAYVKGSGAFYELRLLVKNTGPMDHPNKATKCEFKVWGGKKVGPSGWSYNHTATDYVPKIEPNGSRYCYHKVGEGSTGPKITDPGNYFVSAKLIKP